MWSEIAKSKDFSFKLNRLSDLSSQKSFAQSKEAKEPLNLYHQYIQYLLTKTIIQLEKPPLFSITFEKPKS